MASQQALVDRVAGLLVGEGDVTARKMFGEYALYLGSKLVALICDDQVFVKPTSAGKALLGEPVLAPAYPGAKASFLFADPWDRNTEFVALIRATAQELPEPAPKKPKTPKKPSSGTNLRS